MYRDGYQSHYVIIRQFKHCLYYISLYYIRNIKKVFFIYSYYNFLIYVYILNYRSLMRFVHL